MSQSGFESEYLTQNPEMIPVTCSSINLSNSQYKFHLVPGDQSRNIVIGEEYTFVDWFFETPNPASQAGAVCKPELDMNIHLLRLENHIF
jgi:hypothetical protein